MTTWMKRFGRQARKDPPTKIVPNLGTIVFTDGDTYPVSGLTLRDGCFCVTGKLFAKDYGVALPIEVTVCGEYQVRDPSGKPVAMGWTDRTYPMFMSIPEDSYEVNVSIGPIGTTTSWFKEMVQGK